jgi:uncharacterized Fe-S radical SAM superfamily protein PflX
MKKQVHHEGYNYVLEYDNNSLIMYKEDIDEWMGDVEYVNSTHCGRRYPKTNPTLS